ncbi:MAG: protein kinase family protein [Lewinellaceae bacterium]|nr:protein kinase family protein [Lewinellaceae bacterium]
MILNKYQLRPGSRTERGYSVTAKALDEKGVSYFVKWIRGIAKEGQSAKIFQARMSRFRRAPNESLPKIIDFGFDEREGAYCIVYEELLAFPLEDSYRNMDNLSFLQRMLGLAGCLQELQLQGIYHEDLHPGNILVGQEQQFYLIDLGLSSITATLSQEKDLEIFARAFAAPEKWKPEIVPGFPFKVIFTPSVRCWSGSSGKEEKRFLSIAGADRSTLPRGSCRATDVQPVDPSAQNDLGRLCQSF